MVMLVIAVMMVILRPICGDLEVMVMLVTVVWIWC